jgi:hypothetical protein
VVVTSVCHDHGRQAVAQHLLTYEQAAVRLKCPIRTVQTRLARGRDRLRGRLARRGLGPSAELMAEVLSPHSGSLVVRVSLKQAMVQAALRGAKLKGAAAGASSAAVASADARHQARACEVWSSLAVGCEPTSRLTRPSGRAGWCAPPRSLIPRRDPPAR